LSRLDSSCTGRPAIVRLELPGVDVDKDVTVEIHDGQLTVGGERRDERSENRSGRRLHEVRYGSFRRPSTFPHTLARTPSQRRTTPAC
jgi:HSP20 family molecular chaperone IbpA